MRTANSIIGAGVIAGVVALVLGLLLLGGGDPYRLRLELSTANGLREGSPVKVGGVGVGTISKLDLDDGDRVIAELAIEEDGVRPARSAKARVVTSNLLGSKFVDLQPGRGAALPDGSLLPVNRVAYPVDLDEVVNVLDGDTRARLQVLINEAGTGLSGRRADWSETLRVLGPTLADADAVVAELTRDNRSLAQLMESGSGVVSRLSAERRQLTRLVTVARDAMRTTAERRAELQRTLASAPATLRTARGFLADLEATTEPLGPAARLLAESGPPLSTALAELPDFQRAADPTLRQAGATAPALTSLARGATPVLRRALPTVQETRRMASTAAPVTRTLRLAIDDTLGLVEGWGRAIQTRDRLGHVFRGRAAVGVETFRSLIAQLTEIANPPREQDDGKRRTPAAAGAKPQQSRPAAPARPQVARPKPPALPKLPLVDDVRDVLPDLGPQVDGLLDDLLGPRDPGRGSGDLKPLLDYLLAP